MKKLFICGLAVIGMSGMAMAQAKKTTVKSVTKSTTTTKPVASIMKNLNDSFSYAAGINIANSMREQGITKLNSSLVQKAIQDVFNNGKLLLTAEQANMTLQQQLQLFAQLKIDAEKAKGKAFLNANRSRKGVNVLQSGLQYEIVTAGEVNGLRPTAVDTVVVDYAGRLIDGMEFDGSAKTGQPVTFRLNEVIPGWTEIIQLMTKGAHWKVVIPAEMGYNENPPPGAPIPPGATLIFDITLRDIKPAGKL
ncbi:MAG: peptidylprolyl isomerase [Ferruginibacter sp.]|nr:peptidylprolyl isomerase [Ferruginibacter sp.]